MPKEIVYSVQVMRAIAAVLVVATHVVGVIPAGGGWMPNLTDVNIIFTFAAGFLFRLLSFNEDYTSFLKRRFMNVIIPYVIISIPALLIYTVLGKSHPNVDLSVIPQWGLPVYLLVTGLHLGPLWFIPMITITYILTPVIRLADGPASRYLTVFLIGAVLSTFVFLRPIYNENPIMAFLHFWPVFVFGMFCAKFRKDFENFASKPGVAWGAVLGVVLLFAVTSDISEQYQFPIKLVILALTFVATCRFQAKNSRLVATLAQYSFPIYFLHGYLVSVFRARPDLLLGLQGPVAVIFGTITVCIVCVALAKVVQLVLKKRSRYVVGL